MTIRRHILLLLIVAVSALMTLGGTALLQFKHNNTAMRNLTDGSLPGFLGASELNADLKGLQIAVLNQVYAPDDEIAQQFKDKVNSRSCKIHLTHPRPHPRNASEVGSLLSG